MLDRVFGPFRPSFLVHLPELYKATRASQPRVPNRSPYDFWMGSRVSMGVVFEEVLMAGLLRTRPRASARNSQKHSGVVPLVLCVSM